VARKKFRVSQKKLLDFDIERLSKDTSYLPKTLFPSSCIVALIETTCLEWRWKHLIAILTPIEVL